MEKRVEITGALIERLADLARIKITGMEKERLKSDLESILKYVEMIRTAQPVGCGRTVFGTLENFRADLPGACLKTSEIMKLAPDRIDDYFKVPLVIE